MTVTSAMVKELREATGVGMMDCKKALNETGGDIEKAKDWLREKGLAKAAKKSGRATAEGLVAMAKTDGKGVLVEVNSETDFVAKNEDFQSFVKSIVKSTLENDGDLEKVQAEKADELTSKIASIGENLQIRRAAGLKADVVAGYIHSAVADGMGKIGVLVAVDGAENNDANNEILKKIAMHIAAASPLFATVEDVDQDVLDKEKSFFKKDAEASGKPAEIIEKMLVGRVRKYYEEVVLLEQSFVMDQNKKIKDLIKEMGSDAKLVGFKKLVLGEGVEKKEENFAEEVAKMQG